MMSNVSNLRPIIQFSLAPPTILKNLITQAGLEIDAVIYAGFHRLGPIGKWLANAYPSLFAHSFAVRLRKGKIIKNSGKPHADVDILVETETDFE